MAAVKTLVTTGLRLQELASLLTFDLDHAVSMERANSIEMESITKNQVNRNAVIPSYALDSIRRYRRTERPNVVLRNQRSLRRNLDRCFVVEHFDPMTRVLAGWWQGGSREFRLHLVPVEMRLRAVTVGVDGRIDPLCVFLSESRGLGMTRSGWEGVFVAISDQMLRATPAERWVRKVTPHDLRHTFAINYLRAALAEKLKTVSVPANNAPPLRDPLIDLQELLGHASSAQTLRYLRYVEDIDRMVSAAVPDFGLDEDCDDAREE
ncbi:hypothetical protein [Mycolicibacterium llatzerense]|uniref:hypothetical protein n=1 Tax=Mycolicibacterium llatzerense TaxID=280871 RepID=UPI0036063F7F